VITYKQFLGINNVEDPTRVKPGEMLVASNVDIAGTLLSRRGRTRLKAGAAHSLYEAPFGLLAVVDNDLLLLAADGTEVRTVYETIGYTRVWYADLPDGRVALLKRSIEPGFGKWTYPAGYQEIGESVADAAVRETHEEICVRVKLTGLVGVYSYAGAGVVASVFVGRVPKSQRPRPGEESQDVKLFKIEELPWKELAFRSTTDALKDWIKSL
jgi:ADP-ribose pyrophosphatase YjhB (NUDIX family)